MPASIYVQAKCYAADRSVGRPEIQEFVGALHGAQADRGIFITTGRFTSEAKDYADRVAARLVLIDGRMLSSQMRSSVPCSPSYRTPKPAVAGIPRPAR